MLYVKVDNAGNPVEVAKNYREIRTEFLARNSIIPNEDNFFLNVKRLGYAPVPEDGINPPKQAGMKPVPDVPVKDGQGNFSRKWKLVPCSPEEVRTTSAIMRKRRDSILAKYIDTISPVRWEDMSEEDKGTISSWRKELLNITKDPAFPFVMFPKVPEILV